MTANKQSIRLPVFGREATGYGEVGLIERSEKLALFCSVKCPGNLILRAYDFSRIARGMNGTIVSGFHSPIEKDCLKILLQGRASIIICLGHRLTTLRLPKEWQIALEDQRLLILSPFNKKQNRVTRSLAADRNGFVASLADKLLIVYANSGGITETLGMEMLAKGKRVYTFNDEANETLIGAGAIAVVPEFFAAKQS